MAWQYVYKWGQSSPYKSFCVVVLGPTTISKTILHKLKNKFIQPDPLLQYTFTFCILACQGHIDLKHLNILLDNWNGRRAYKWNFIGRTHIFEFFSISFGKWRGSQLLFDDDVFWFSDNTWTYWFAHILVWYKILRSLLKYGIRGVSTIEDILNRPLLFCDILQSVRY